MTLDASSGTAGNRPHTITRGRSHHGQRRFYDQLESLTKPQRESITSKQLQSLTPADSQFLTLTQIPLSTTAQVGSIDEVWSFRLLAQASRSPSTAAQVQQLDMETIPLRLSPTATAGLLSPQQTKVAHSFEPLRSLTEYTNELKNHQLVYVEVNWS